MLPYWYDGIVPDLLAGRTVLIAAHGNSLRALVKHLDGISDADIAGLNISDRHPCSPTNWTPTSTRSPRAARTRPGGRAAAAIEAVKNQGKKK